MSYLQPLLHCMRPNVAILAGLGAAATTLFVTATTEPLHIHVLVFIVLFCATSGGFLINDAFDIDKDRIAHPERPLPSGKLSPDIAMTAAGVLFVLALVSAVPLGTSTFILVCFNILMLLGYSHLLLWNGIVGNVVAAYLSASLILLGGILGGNTWLVMPATFFVFFFMLVRELIFDLRDVKGDSSVGMLTIATCYGPNGVFFVIRLLLFGLWCALLLALAFGVLSWLQLLPTMVALTLLTAGSEQCKKQRDTDAYQSFVWLSRTAMAILIPGMVFASHGLAAGSPPPPDNEVVEGAMQLYGFLPGAFSYVLVGVALTFFFIANHLLDEVVENSRLSLTRLDARWRFYSVFGAMMFMIIVQGLAFAYFAEQGFPQVFLEGDRYAMLAFVVGLVPLPAVLLELVLSRNWSELGFTRYYEDNLRETIPSFFNLSGQDSKPEISTSKGAVVSLLHRLLFRRLAFFLTWLLVYAITPLFVVFHIKKNFRRPNLTSPSKVVQLGQDMLVSCTVWVFFLGLIAAFMDIAGLAQVVNAPVWLKSAFVFLTIVSAILMIVPWFVLGREARSDLPLFFISFFYLLALIVGDFWLSTQNSTVVDDYLGYTLLGWAGGYTPLVLVFVVSWMARVFLHEITRARRTVAEVLRSDIAVNFADRAIHTFNNKLHPIQSALQHVRDHIRDKDALAELMENRERLKELEKTVLIAMRSVSEALEAIADTKGRIREERAIPHSVEKLLASISGFTYQLREHRMVLEPSVSVPKGIALIVDDRLFRDVLQNLIKNAVDAVLTKGVSVAKEKPPITIQATYNKADRFPFVIRVHDDGIGMATSFGEQAVRPYVSTKGRGSGLGLHIVSSFMESIGGKLVIDSREGVDSYTTVMLSFPPEIIRDPGR